MIGIVLIIIGIVSFIPVIPIPGLAHLHTTIKGLGTFSGPAGIVLILIGAILYKLGF